MPYNDVRELPDYIKKYDIMLQKQFLHVFNSVYEKVLKETGNVKSAETRAFKAGHSVLKSRFTKKDGMEKNSRHDYMNHLVDSWLGNLQG